jgi:hypothetical protein
MAKSFGYLFVDHRNSPGIPEDVARKMGYEPSLVGEGKLMEADTMTCAHCKNIIVRNPDRTRERYYCMACGGDYICDLCNIERLKPDYKHLPFQKIVDLVGAGEAIAVQLGVQPLLVPTKKTYT